MIFEILRGIFIPFIGTTLGARCVFVMKKQINEALQKALLGFAGGVMVAASVWSLLIPSMDSSNMGKLSFIPTVVGFFAGVLFLLFLDKAIPHTHINNESEGPCSKFKKSTMLVLAVSLHNIPEGMAVGAVYAGWLSNDANISALGALILSVGISIQNFPEGAIISMPLKSEGESKKKAFFAGVLSGILEPISAGITILAADILVPILPYLLSFAAGAMIFVVVEELIPDMTNGNHSKDIGVIFFAIGFCIMMSLDVALS